MRTPLFLPFSRYGWGVSQRRLAPVFTSFTVEGEVDTLLDDILQHLRELRRELYDVSRFDDDGGCLWYQPVKDS